MRFTSTTAAKTEFAGEILGKRVRLRPEWAKTLFLFGEMGAGKTTFLRGFARGLGIMEPVSSPTYALAAEYAIPNNLAGLATFSHFDLYRAQDASALSLPEVMEVIDDKTGVAAIEWSENFPQAKLPDSRIEIHFSHPNAASGEYREIEIRFYDHGIPTHDEIESLYHAFATPKHVKNHILAVTRVAEFFAQKLAVNGIPINLKLVSAGALLHDFVRVCNFKNLDASCFHEEVTPQKISIWNGLIAKYGNRHHAEAGAEVLHDLGFVATADVVSRHNTASALLELTLEEKCVLLGDRHVLHSTVVPLEKRMQDGIFRHNHNAHPRAIEIKRRIEEILAEICKLGAISDNIHEIIPEGA